MATPYTRVTRKAVKILEEKYHFEIGTLNPHVISECFLLNYFILVFLRCHTPTNSVAPPFVIFGCSVSASSLVPLVTIQTNIQPTIR